jgi:hypothetical protein
LFQLPRLRTLAPISAALNEHKALAEWHWQRSAEVHGEKPVPRKSHVDCPAIEPKPPLWQAGI